MIYLLMNLNIIAISYSHRYEGAFKTALGLGCNRVHLKFFCGVRVAHLFMVFLCVFLILVYAFTFLVPCCDAGVNFRCSVHLYP
jgi:hypothetical protein